MKALKATEDFPSGDTADAITVFHREGGLTAADRAAIAEVRSATNAERLEGVGVTGPAGRLEGRRHGALDHADQGR